MICAKSEAIQFSALQKRSETTVASELLAKNQNLTLNKSRIKRNLKGKLCMPILFQVAVLLFAKADAQTFELSSVLNREVKNREIAVLDSVTCGYVQGKWVPGSVSRDGYFTPLQNQIAKVARQIKNATARGAASSKVNRLNRRLKALRQSQRIEIRTCRTVGTAPDTFGTPVYTPTSPGTGIGGQTPGVNATETPRPTRTPTAVADDSATPNPRPTRTPTATPDDSATATPRPTRTATPTSTPVQTLAFKISLVDPCSNGPVNEFDPITDGASIDLQQVPANANVVANIVSGDKSQVQSLRIRIGGGTPVIVNSTGPVVAYEPVVDPLSPHQPVAGDIYPGKLPVGTYLIHTSAFSGVNGTGTELGSTQITVTVSNSDITSKATLNFADYGYGSTPSTAKIYEPQETSTGCIRAGISDGAKVAVVDLSNHNASGFNVDLDATRDWTNGKVGVGYDGEVAVVSPIDFSKFNLGFYEPNRDWKFGGEVFGIPLEIDTLAQPVVTLQYLFVSGWGWGAEFGGTSSFLLDHLHDGTVKKVDIMEGPLPSKYYPDNFGGLYGIAAYNSACDPGYLFHIREGALVNGENKRFAEPSIAPDFCLLNSVAEVANANRDIYVVGAGTLEDGNSPRLIISRYDRGVTFAGQGQPPLEAAPARKMSVTLPFKPGLRDIAVLEDGKIAVLFHEIDPATVNYSVTPLALTHTIAFYSNAGAFIRESTVALPFAASGMKAVTGGKLVLYGPSQDSEQLTNGQAHIAVVY